jgi:hypothetical protein
MPAELKIDMPICQWNIQYFDCYTYKKSFLSKVLYTKRVRNFKFTLGLGKQEMRMPCYHFLY